MVLAVIERAYTYIVVTAFIISIIAILWLAVIVSWSFIIRLVLKAWREAK